MVTNVDSIILDRYSFMYIMSVKKQLQVLIVLGILVFDQLSILTLIRRGGANMPHRFSNAYSSGTESRIDLKPGCKFEFIRCLEV